MEDIESHLAKAKSGSVDDMRALGLHYLNVEKDFKQSLIWLQRAYAAGDDHAGYLRANVLFKLDELSAAERILREVAMKKHMLSQYWLGALLIKGTFRGGPEEGVSLMRAAASAGHIHAKIWLLGHKWKQASLIERMLLAIRFLPLPLKAFFISLKNPSDLRIRKA